MKETMKPPKEGNSRAGKSPEPQKGARAAKNAEKDRSGSPSELGPRRYCFEGDFCSPTASGRIIRELVLGARSLEMPLAMKQRKTYLHSPDFPVSKFLKSLAERPPSGQVRIICAPAFSLPEKVDRGIFWAISGFDPLHPTNVELERLSRPDRVWVTSPAHLQAFNAKHKDRKVSLLELAVNEKIFSPFAKRPAMLKDNKCFTFLAVLNPLRRKGLDILLRAYIEEFKPREPVKLILKMTHMPKLKKNFPYEIGDLAKRLGALNRMFAPVEVIAKTVDDDELAGLMSGCNALVSVNRAYHTALVVRESMACGLPVIGPKLLKELVGVDEKSAWFFLTKKTSMEAGSLFPDSPATTVEEPEIVSLRMAMRAAFVQAEQTRERGLAALEISRKWKSWTDLAEKMRDIFQTG